MTRKISIANQKGGCGKTATSINLAAALAEKGKKVLLIDLDPQLHASEGVGIDPYQEDIIKNNVYNLIFDDDVTFESVIIPTEIKNLDVIPSSVDLEETDLEFFKASRAEYKLYDKLEEINNYDYVIFDCPPRLNYLTKNALTASDSLIIPISTIGKRSLKNLPQFMNFVKTIQHKVNSKLKIMGYLINMHRKNVNVNEGILSKTREMFGDLVFDTAISFSSSLAEADLYDEPVISLLKNSKLADEYRSLAKEVLNR
jgi:chromosome partitioning protein